MRNIVQASILLIGVATIVAYALLSNSHLNNEKAQMETFFHLCSKTGMTQDECNFEWIKVEVSK